MKTIIIGSGFLGSTLANIFKENGVFVVETTKSGKNKTIKLDIENLSDIEKIINKNKPDVIINSAALTSVDFLEKNPELAFRVNAIGVKNIAIVASKTNTKFIQISTDSVFDGKKGMYTETDKPNPINVYAKSKLQGEEYIKEICENYIIIRTNFYGKNTQSKFLFENIVDSFRKSKSIIGFEDVIFTPLEITNLCYLIFDLLYSEYKGIINLSSDEVMSKFDFCKNIVNTLNFDEALLKKGSIKNMDFIAKRPKNTSLSNKLSKKFLHHKILPMNEWLKKLK